MAYLGIRESENVKEVGVFYFDVMSVRNEVAENFENPIYYTNGEKNKALKDFGIEEKDIQDGIILIHKYRKNGKPKREEPEEKCYLGVRGTPFDGVYEFNKRRIRDKIAKQFADTIMSMDLNVLLKEFNIDKSELRDGGFLLGKEVTIYLKNHKIPTTSNNEKLENKVSEKVVEVCSKNLLEEMIGVLSEDRDVIEVFMNEGTVYRFAMKDIFLLNNDTDLKNTATMDSSGNVQVNASVIDKLIDNGDIIRISASNISYHNGYAVGYNCDDLGSPVIKVEEDGRYIIKHYFDKMVLNVNAVSHVLGADTYREIAIPYHKISSQKNKVIYDYLVNRFN